MKAYVKPELFYERYELSKHIADCAWELNSADQNSCGFKGDEGKNLVGIVYAQEGICNITNYEAYCYQGGADASRLFIS